MKEIQSITFSLTYFLPGLMPQEAQELSLFLLFVGLILFYWSCWVYCSSSTQGLVNPSRGDLWDLRVILPTGFHTFPSFQFREFYVVSEDFVSRCPGLLSNFYYRSPKQCFDLEEVTCCYLWLFQVCSMYSSRAPLWTSTTHNVTIWKVSSVSNQPIRAKENIIRSQWELVNNCVW